MLYQYYEQQGFNPTFCNFKSPEELEHYGMQREEVYTHKLHLSKEFFKGKHVLEIGSSTGENALIFAQWGAHCTLVEPVADYHEQIREYFNRFNLSSSLKHIEASDLLSYKSDTKFDVINAEGFIYTIQPTEQWLSHLNGICQDGGYVVVSYMESLGSFFELLLQLVHKRVRDHYDLEPVAAATKLYQNKWDSIPHSRSFESWVFDVLENPYVRAKYFLEASNFVQLAAENGFELYSSFPTYKDYGEVYWSKKFYTKKQKLELSRNYIVRNALSYFFGQRFEIWNEDQEVTLEIKELLDDMIGHIDQLIDQFSVEVCSQILSYFKAIRQRVESAPVNFQWADHRGNILEIIDMATTIFSHLKDNKIDELVTFCQTDKCFIETWGTPAHYAVFRKES